MRKEKEKGGKTRYLTWKSSGYKKNAGKMKWGNGTTFNRQRNVSEGNLKKASWRGI